MLRALIILVLSLQPLAAFARCEGTDLIAAMPKTERDALESQAAAMPHSEGLLWQATRGDTRITLFGTYHFPHDETLRHLENLKPMIETAGAVYLEVSNDDQSAMERALAEDPSLMFITEGKTLPDLLEEDEWQRFSDEMRARTIPPFFAAKFKPVWAAMMLGIGPCEARNGAMDGAGIDKLIGDHAASRGTPSRSLEDFRTLLEMLDSFPMDEQLDMIRLFFAWPGNPDDMAYTLRQRYLNQEIALIWSYSRAVSVTFGGDAAQEDFDRFERLLLTDRNTGWIDVLLNAPEDVLFAAVGAAHLPGENGVLHLLENEGFTIERLPF
ncbi:TraB/GumN family protein [Roseovarius sp. PS-C2]|uniref:TraB/GumN family protein n=1 Tax=Roseovarius sp. PS-C2 TaxID=2820814 RepID=UPI001C0D6007|nr:TraB/GumN family protein [Roseovarius sp. PS-C2]MBU3259043.1 TraB/GumN family protein [Roseovarius sp. PS-C2]